LSTRTRPVEGRGRRGRGLRGGALDPFEDPGDESVVPEDDEDDELSTE
jgi:hypothetical protein